MVEMGDNQDSQRLKEIAAASYDYDNDPRWADYWSNVLLPPFMASRPEVVLHFKRKFYQRFIDPDLVVEPVPFSSSSQYTRPSASSSASPATEQTRSQNLGSTARTSRASTTPSTNPGSLHWDQQAIQFSVNAWVFIVALLAIFPLAPRNLSNRAYRLSFMGTACSSLYSLYSLYGKPRAWNLQALQVWFQPVIAAKEFIRFLYCLMFVTSHLHLKFALIPVICQSLEHVAKFLRRNFSHSSLYRKYLEDPCLWVESNTTTLNILTAHAVVALGFLLIISLFSWQRNIMQTFMYWQLLKLTYHAPVTSRYQQNVWANIGRIVHPLVNQYAPFLNIPLSAAERWWFRWMHPYMNPLLGAIVAAKTGMETPVLPDQQGQQQPVIYPEAASNSAWHNSGSVGPFFAVISVITVLAVISCILGRVCVGREVHPLENIRNRGCSGWLRRCRQCMGGDVEIGAKVGTTEGNRNGKARRGEPSSTPPA